MKTKRAIRYLRISTDRQSNFSISGQDQQTMHWCEINKVEIVDTFIDKGFSAKNFDRPDMNRLNSFIQKHYRTVDYLVVNDFTRFSRDAGEALVEIKKLQRLYSIKIVSTSEGVTVDYDDPGSFFFAGLRFLQGEDEIIRNRSRINLGIYTAKKGQGRYLGAAPFGYKNARDKRNVPIIIVDEARSPIVRFIYESFLNDVPLKAIETQARKMGFTLKGNSCIPKLLKNCVYTGMLSVKAYKDNPAEVVEAIHEPIIDRRQWYKVQEKIAGRSKQPQVMVSDSLPLRSVLLCHCGVPLTGAPSRSSSGAYYDYYKCKVSGHNNISALKAHSQLKEIWKYLSLPNHIIEAVHESSSELLEQRMTDNSKMLSDRLKQLADAEKKLLSVEEKWISNQLSFETYQRWYSDLTNQRMSLKSQVERLSQKHDEVHLLLKSELSKLQDLNHIYDIASTVQKQQLVRLVFDRQLYYKDSTYRTKSLMPIFMHNELKLSEMNLLFVDKKRGLSMKVPSGGAEGSRTLVQTHLT